MTGLNITVAIDDAEVRAALAGLAAAAADLTPAMDEIGATVADHARDRFERQQDPDGRPWKPHAPATILRRLLRGGGRRTGRTGRPGFNPQILLDTGRLRDSITHRAARDSVTIGTNVVYAAIHQLGGQAGRGRKVTIPARPFLGLDDADREDIPAILRRHLLRGLA